MPRNRRSQRHYSRGDLKLDLHGFHIEEARKALTEFIESFYNSEEECDIITGNSIKMKMMVKEVLTEYKMEFREGDLLGNNSGYIKTWL